MKIALVSPYDYAYPGGVVNHINSLYKNFIRLGHDVRIIAPTSRPISTCGDNLIPTGKPRAVPTANGSICRIALSPRLPFSVKEVLAREKFDIIHLHEPLTPMVCASILRVSDTATIGTFHACDNNIYSYASPLIPIFLRKWFNKLDGKIAVSKAALANISKYFTGNYTIIPNGVDLELFSPKTEPMGELKELLDGKINILFVGRLEKRKGLKYLLMAYRQLKQNFPKCRLIVVGPPARLQVRYEKLVTKYEMKDVLFIGPVAHHELPKYYQIADIFCAPSTGGESFGLILLEAMAMGKPVVATSIQGYTDLVNNGVEGLLVPPKDSEKLAEALISLSMDERLRLQMGSMGMAKAKNYAWNHIAQILLDYYSKVLGDSR